MIKIIFEDNHLLVVEKPINLPVNSDSSHDPNLLDLLKEDLKKRYQKQGRIYLGLVHRLDRPVGGLMVFAKTSKAAARLSKQLQDKSFQKTYLAVVLGQTPAFANYQDYLLKDNNTNITKVDPQGKLALLSYQTLFFSEDLSLVEINLETGRSHQIRVQFAFHGFPLWGDQKYNKEAIVGQQLALYAAKLSFLHPISQERLTFQLLPHTLPFNLFKL